jgi:hypothetical protein
MFENQRNTQMRPYPTLIIGTPETLVQSIWPRKTVSTELLDLLQLRFSEYYVPPMRFFSRLLMKLPEFITLDRISIFGVSSWR